MLIAAGLVRRPGGGNHCSCGHVRWPDTKIEALTCDLTNRMALSIASELAAKWPFAIRRIRLSVFGRLSRPAWRQPIDTALLLGLSGIRADAYGDPDRKKAFLLQDRMMAIRLARRSLVAFHPIRDVQHRTDTIGLWPYRISVSLHMNGDARVTLTERVARPDLIGFFSPSRGPNDHTETQPARSLAP